MNQKKLETIYKYINSSNTRIKKLQEENNIMKKKLIMRINKYQLTKTT